MSSFLCQMLHSLWKFITFWIQSIHTVSYSSSTSSGGCLLAVFVAILLSESFYGVSLAQWVAQCITIAMIIDLNLLYVCICVRARARLCVCILCLSPISFAVVFNILQSFSWIHRHWDCLTAIFCLCLRAKQCTKAKAILKRIGLNRRNRKNLWERHCEVKEEKERVIYEVEARERMKDGWSWSEREIGRYYIVEVRKSWKI